MRFALSNLINELYGLNLELDVEQNLLLKITLAKCKVNVTRGYHRPFRKQRRHQIRGEICLRSNVWNTHQNTSAGSAVRTLRMAIMAENPHMITVSRNTNTALSTVMENCI